MKNLFSKNSWFYPFRWYLLVVLVLGATLGYANLTGWRLLAGGQQQWNASGPGGHHK